MGKLILALQILQKIGDSVSLCNSVSEASPYAIGNSSGDTIILGLEISERDEYSVMCGYTEAPDIISAATQISGYGQGESLTGYSRVPFVANGLLEFWIAGDFEGGGTAPTQFDLCKVDYSGIKRYSAASADPIQLHYNDLTDYRSFEIQNSSNVSVTSGYELLAYTTYDSQFVLVVLQGVRVLVIAYNHPTPGTFEIDSHTYAGFASSHYAYMYVMMWSGTFYAQLQLQNVGPALYLTNSYHDNQAGFDANGTLVAVCGKTAFFQDGSNLRLLINITGQVIRQSFTLTNTFLCCGQPTQQLYYSFLLQVSSGQIYLVYTTNYNNNQILRLIMQNSGTFASFTHLAYATDQRYINMIAQTNSFNGSALGSQFIYVQYIRKQEDIAQECGSEDISQDDISNLSMTLTSYPVSGPDITSNEVTEIHLDTTSAISYLEVPQNSYLYLEGSCSSADQTVTSNNVEISSPINFQKDSVISSTLYTETYTSDCTSSSVPVDYSEVTPADSTATFVSGSASGIEIDDTADDFEVGTYIFDVQVENQAQDIILDTFQVTVEITPGTNSPPSITNVDCEEFELEDDTEFYTCQVTYSDPNSRDTLTLLVEPENSNVSIEGNFITFANLDPKGLGSFDFQIIVRDDNWAEDPAGELQDSFSLTGTFSYPSGSVSELDYLGPVLVQPFDVLSGVVFDLDLESYLSENIIDQVKLDINVNGKDKLPHFMTKNKLFVTLNPLWTDLGNYQVFLTLQNKKNSPIGPYMCLTSFVFRVVENPEINQEEEIQEVDESITEEQILEKALELQEELDKEEKEAKKPTLRARQVNREGVATLRFDQKMLAFEKSIRYLNSKVFEFDFKSEYHSEENRISNWTLLDYTEDWIRFSFNLTEKESISQFENPDHLTLKIKMPQIFISFETGLTLEEDTYFKIPIRPQIEALPNEEQIISTGKIANGTGILAFLVNFFARLLMQMTLQMFFCLLNTLQLIVHLPLFKVNFPDMALKFSAISKFQIDEPLTIQAGRSGYGDRNFIQNCGSVFWFIVLYFFGLFLFSLILKVFRVNQERKWVKTANSFFKYNFLISLFIEGYIELQISAVIQIQANENKTWEEISSKNGELFGYICAIIFIASSSAAIIVILAFLFKRWRKVSSQKFKNSFQSLVEGFRTNQRQPVMYNGYFLLRRQLLALILLFFYNNAGLQIICLNLVSTFFIIYVIAIFPNQDKNFNYIEIMNEETIKLLELFMIIFSDFNPYLEVKNSWQVLYCATISACILGNFSYVIYVSVIVPLRKAYIRKYYPEQVIARYRRILRRNKKKAKISGILKPQSLGPGDFEFQDQSQRELIHKDSALLEVEEQKKAKMAKFQDFLLNEENQVFERNGVNRKNKYKLKFKIEDVKIEMISFDEEEKNNNQEEEKLQDMESQDVNEENSQYNCSQKSQDNEQLKSFEQEEEKIQENEAIKDQREEQVQTKPRRKKKKVQKKRVDGITHIIGVQNVNY